MSAFFQTFKFCMTTLISRFWKTFSFVSYKSVPYEDRLLVGSRGLHPRVQRKDSTFSKPTFIPPACNISAAILSWQHFFRLLSFVWQLWFPVSGRLFHLLVHCHPVLRNLNHSGFPLSAFCSTCLKVGLLMSLASAKNSLISRMFYH